MKKLQHYMKKLQHYSNCCSYCLKRRRYFVQWWLRVSITNLTTAINSWAGRHCHVINQRSSKMRSKNQSKAYHPKKKWNTEIGAQMIKLCFRFSFKTSNPWRKVKRWWKLVIFSRWGQHAGKQMTSAMSYSTSESRNNILPNKVH